MSEFSISIINDERALREAMENTQPGSSVGLLFHDVLLRVVPQLGEVPHLVGGVLVKFPTKKERKQK